MAQNTNDLGPMTPSMAYEKMSPVWRKIETLLQGTESMRSAGQLYLPQHFRESDDAYKERLNRNVLLNMLQMTLDAWVGKPFSEPIKVSETVPAQLQDLFKNVDLLGNSLDVFSRNWFRDGVAKSFSHVFVDQPRLNPQSVDGGPRTLADDRAEAVRPYFIHIRPENIVFGNADVEGGQEVVRLIRVVEQLVEIDGWSEKVVNQVRVVTPGHVKVYQERKDPKTKKVSWRIVDEYDYALDFVPLVTFYADRQGFMEGKPPLADLADLNVAHWQSAADQSAVLTVARFPMLGCSGGISDEELVVGPHAWLKTPDPAGRFYYIEHSGKAINAGRTDLLDREEVMAEYGATFLKKRPGGASATARALDSAEVTSPLQDMAIRFDAALNQALRYAGAWLGFGPDEIGEVHVNTDFDFADGDQPALTAVVAARENGDLSRTRVCQELHRMRVLGDDFDAAVNDQELKAEQDEALKQQEKQLQLQQKYAPAPAPTAAPPPGQKGTTKTKKAAPTPPK